MSRFTECACGRVALPNTKRMVSTFPEGVVTLLFPLGMSMQSIDELDAAIAHQLRVLRRSAAMQQLPPVEPPPAQGEGA